MYFARMCFEVVVFGLCIVRKTAKALRNLVPTRGLRLTNWQLLSAERGREQGNGGNCLRIRAGEGGNALLSAACGGKERKSGRLWSESRLFFGKTSGLLPKSPQVFPHRSGEAHRSGLVVRATGGVSGGTLLICAEEQSKTSPLRRRSAAKGRVVEHLSLVARGT